MGFQSMAISLVLIGLFVFAAYNFGETFAQDNGANTTLSDDPYIAQVKANISSNLNAYDEAAQGADNAFSNSTATVGAESLQIVAVANIWQNMVAIPSIIYYSTLGLALDKIFGGSSSSNDFSILFTVLSGILVISIILLAWYWIRSGVPD